ncbi:hypothetical protein SeseC_00036 [Streptococcus equi subsp. zooepidemicus ATCC 35246]|nr:hypothetical protein SeseC_00036 [Streptococcus equi subsp. zooepidemicus ATCC 35246]
MLLATGSRQARDGLAYWLLEAREHQQYFEAKIFFLTFF